MVKEDGELQGSLKAPKIKGLGEMVLPYIRAMIGHSGNQTDQVLSDMKPETRKLFLSERSRVIGYSLNRAAPGHQLDIILNR
tara:strand:- start:72 stop:317 length:246 start_codon:yes stop_codon:yes gene_type:complete